MSDAFAGETGAPAPRFESIQLDLLSPDPNQPRKTFDKEALKSLSDSIKENGLVQPIVTRPKPEGGFEIVAGERRWRAAKQAGLEQVPAIVREDLVGKDVIVLQVLENLQREDLPLAETAAGVARLVALEGVAKACELLGKSEAWVSRHAGVTKLPAPVQRLVNDGIVSSADIAYDLGELQQLDKQRADRLIGKFVHSSGPNAWNQPPTSRELRETLKRAKDSSKVKKKQAEERKKLKEKAKSDPKIAKQLAAEKRKKESREGIRARVDAFRKEADAFAEGIAAQLCERLGVKKSNGYHAPLYVDSRFYGGGDKEPPKSVLEASYHVGASGTYQEIEKAVQLVAPDAKLEIDVLDDVTIVEAAKLAEILGGKRITFRMHVDRPGKKLQALVDHEMNGGKGSKDPEAQPIHRFLSERTTKGLPAQRIKASELHAAYVAWCKANKLTPEALTSNEWGNAIKAAGLAKIRSNGLHYQGVKLVEVA